MEGLTACIEQLNRQLKQEQKEAREKNHNKIDKLASRLFACRRFGFRLGCFGGGLLGRLLLARVLNCVLTWGLGLGLGQRACGGARFFGLRFFRGRLLRSLGARRALLFLGRFAEGRGPAVGVLFAGSYT